MRPLHAVIRSDSSSSLVRLQSSDGGAEIQQTRFRTHVMQLTGVFMDSGALWSQETSKGTKHGVVDMAVSFGQAEIKSMVRQEVRKRWQRQWEEERKRRWLCRIQRRMGATGWSRREEVVISRMRFGHTGLTTTLLVMGKHNTGECDYCGEEETCSVTSNRTFVIKGHQALFQF